MLCRSSTSTCSAAAGTRAPPHRACSTMLCRSSTYYYDSVWDAPAGTSNITMALCITLSITPSVHAVLLSFLLSFPSLRQRRCTSRYCSTTTHSMQHHAVQELHLLRQCVEMHQQVLATSPWHSASLSPSLHPSMLSSSPSFSPSHHYDRGDVLAGTAAPPHIACSTMLCRSSIYYDSVEMHQQVLALPPTMLSDEEVELARYRPKHAVHLGCRGGGRQALLLRSVASSAELMLSYILQAARSRAGASTVLRRVSTPPTSTMR